ncbi:GNAT family N-acetyltransferase [Haloferula sp. BvORR071]|uniref:GNAT family N-acetyltransferase n=1 Tax=Haloferula sp. BvORR071 TaxID=1396141 RepID=UPI00055166A8|nr:GNAT family N-acetyltransferase [Haloferula sp. BvORR071]
MAALIRPFAEADTAALAALLGELGYPTTAGELRGRLAQLGSHHHTLVAEAPDGGAITGFIGLMRVATYEHSAPIGYILALSVSSSSQGQGIGKALVSAAEDWFRAQGIHEIRVNSGLQREGAHRFYEAAGFTITGHRFRKRLTL